MDHMRISGIEPSSVILSQTCSIKRLKVMTKKCQIKLKPKGMENSLQHMLMTIELQGLNKALYASKMNKKY